MFSSSCRCKRAPVTPARIQPVRAVANKQTAPDASILKNVTAVTLTNLAMTLPAYADAGKLFDFDLTMPIMAGQFLLLMVFLDKTWFTPVGQVLDERDELIRSRLASVQGDSGKIAEMLEQAERELKEARADANKAVAEARAAAQAEQEAKLSALRAQLDSELATAMAELDKEREVASASVDEQVEALSEEIMARVLPDEPEPVAA